MSSPLHNLALIRPGVKTRRISSYDRSGGNSDFIPIAAREAPAHAADWLLRNPQMAR